MDLKYWVKITPNYRIIVLDTETTGLGPDDEILQFSAMYFDWKEALNIYIKPSHTDQWDEAMAINHITPEMVEKCPKMSKAKKKIEALLKKAEIVVGYNLDFDLRMLKQNGVKVPAENEIIYIDIMKPFAKIYGEWSNYFDDYKWQKLKTCARYYGYRSQNWHDSLADARATLYCFKKMVQKRQI